MSVLPEDVMKLVDAEFKTLQSKAVAMELLTVWRGMPSWKEKEAIGERHGRNVKTVHDISQTLQKLELFTAEQGSIPLLRMELESKKVSPSGVEGLQEDAESENIMSELPEFSPMGVPLEDDPEVITDPPYGEVPDDLGALQNKVFRIEAQLGGLGKKLDLVIPVIQGLSAKNPGNPGLPSTPIPETPPTENPKAIVPSDSLEERLERIEGMLQDNGEVDPLGDLSRDQIVELLRSQPKELMSMVNPDGAGRTGRVEAQAVTLRPVILMLTTYSQMLYERAVFDGYFEGTLSDFANFTMEQYFTDRGWSLDWNKREPAGRGRRLG